ncbi:MAG: flavin reductase family protein [Actinomycetota bacterium]|nr:flavin reductase family protein [Actinomycetota bacterium]
MLAQLAGQGRLPRRLHQPVQYRPPRFAVGLSRKNHTYRVARGCRHPRRHALGGEERELAELFGHHTADEADKSSRCSWHPGPGGVPVLDDCPGSFARRVIDHCSDRVDPDVVGDKAERQTVVPPLVRGGAEAGRVRCRSHGRHSIVTASAGSSSPSCASFSTFDRLVNEALSAHGTPVPSAVLDAGARGILDAVSHSRSHPVTGVPWRARRSITPRPRKRSPLA